MALAAIAPGELLVVQADEIDDTVAYLNRRLADDPNIRETDLEQAARLPRQRTLAASR